jgi:hypothetical protein
MIAVQLASAISANIVQLVRCDPISAEWQSHTDDESCQHPRMIFISAYSNGGVAVLTDLILATIPLTFLNNIRRSPRERLVIALLMGLGVFAAVAEAIKLTLMPSYGQTGDMLWDCVPLVTWSILEAQMGIMAACTDPTALLSGLRRACPGIRTKLWSFAVVVEVEDGHGKISDVGGYSLRIIRQYVHRPVISPQTLGQIESPTSLSLSRNPCSTYFSAGATPALSIA